MIGLFFLLFASVVSAEPALPSRAEAIVGKFAAFHGPNCWNSALYGAGVVSGIRHVDYDEFTAWLASPFCKAVEEKSSAAGDIVALRRVSASGRLVDFPFSYEIHGYLLVAPGMAFTKNGATQRDGYQVMSADTLHVNYEAVNKRDCRILGLPKEFCRMKVQYFRCSPVQALGLPAPLIVIEAAILELEAELHRLYTGEAKPSSPEAEKARIKLKVDSLEAQLDAAAADSGDWQIELLRLRLVSARILQF